MAALMVPKQTNLKLSPNIERWIREQAAAMYGSPRRLTRYVEHMALQEMERQRVRQEKLIDETRMRIEKWQGAIEPD